ncbi:MAG: oxidoreductase [Salinibacterium sp.]|nr:oxidoreductase [Salinibacterium sp.]
MGTVSSTHAETPSGRSLWIELPDWPGNIAGQHVDVRLTAPDGYQATRSYSLASSGSAARVQLAVDRLPDGEVSPYLVDDLQPGDMLEVRGPLGGWFVWKEEQTQPVQLIAGGSGVVPLVAMIRAHAASGSTAPMQLLYSVRTPEDRFFADELSALENVTYAYTRSGPTDARIGRLTKEHLASAVLPPGAAVYVCGPTGFVEAVASWLVELGHDAASVKTERFGGA